MAKQSTKWVEKPINPRVNARVVLNDVKVVCRNMAHADEFVKQVERLCKGFAVGDIIYGDIITEELEG